MRRIEGNGSDSVKRYHEGGAESCCGRVRHALSLGPGPAVLHGRAAQRFSAVGQPLAVAAKLAWR
jgi:hypothetical protein